jgi:uncharacterized protein with PQ loop repeat
MSIIDQYFFPYLAIWIVNIGFFVSLIPQILLNYRLKTTKGLSDLFLLATLNGQFGYLSFTFYANLPLIYKVMNSCYFIAILIIIAQRFLYSQNQLKEKRILNFYLLNFLLGLIFIFIAPKISWGISFLGWFPVVLGFWKKWPQVIKIYKEKSVVGFSFLFVLVSICAYLFEMVAGIILKLPLPIIFNDLKGVFVYLIFLVQFMVYRDRGYVRPTQISKSDCLF